MAMTEEQKAKIRESWTPERRAKMSATWARKREEKLARIAKREARLAQQAPVISAEMVTAPIVKAVTPYFTDSFDWKAVPLEDAMQRLADMKREYDRISKIVLERQSMRRPRWTCFTQLHKDIIPVSVQRQCLKGGEDGKWKFRDDGVFKVVDGIRVPDPVFCCSGVCAEYFHKTKQMMALSRH